MVRGPIDGDYQRHRRSLDQAIGLFQQCNRLRPSGKLNRLGSDVNRIENALPASHRKMSGVPGTALVRRQTSNAPARIEDALRRTEKSAPLPVAERVALAALQAGIARAHNLCFEAGEFEVTPDGRFRTMLTCPNSEWLDPRRNVFELGGRIPKALREGLEGTLRAAVDEWKPVPSSGDKPGLVLVTARAFSALKPGAIPERDGLEAFGITQAPSDKVARSCLAGCLQLASSGEVLTPAGRKQFEDLREALGVIDPNSAQALAQGLQTAQAGGTTQQGQQQWMNPTGGALRGYDPKYGDGSFGASRRNSKGQVYSHEGQDYLATLGQDVVAATAGVVSIIGYPYPNNFHHRYVEITTANKERVRHFYVDPAKGIVVGVSVIAGTVIGTYQGLQKKLPGIPGHVHLEVIVGGVKVDPRQFIP